jgi:hypothetical protein
MADKAPDKLTITLDELAAFHIAYQLSQRLMAIVVDHELLTPQGAAELLRHMAASNRKSRGLANRRAAQILEEHAKIYDAPAKPRRH